MKGVQEKLARNKVMSPKRNLRIIVLEDNDNVRTLVTMLLELRGYEVYAFSKPTICPLQIETECRCNQNQSCTDVILTDLDMPEMDGFRFIEHLKKKNCKCQHVAIMSGGLHTKALLRAKQLGCKVFEKPFKRELLFEWLDGIERLVKPSRELCNWFQKPSAS